MRAKSSHTLVSALLLVVLTMASFSKPSETRLRSSVVILRGAERGSCSGVQVEAPSGASYILSAGHCRVLEKNGAILAQTDDGRLIPRRVVEESMDADLLLLEAMPGVAAVKVSGGVAAGDTVTSLTHGSGLPTHKGTGEVLGDMEIEVLDFVMDGTRACEGGKRRKKRVSSWFGDVDACLLVAAVTMTTLNPVSPGSSGGPVFDASGKLVGVISAGDGKYHAVTTTESVQLFLKSY